MGELAAVLKDHRLRPAGLPFPYGQWRGTADAGFRGHRDVQAMVTVVDIAVVS